MSGFFWLLPANIRRAGKCDTGGVKRSARVLGISDTCRSRRRLSFVFVLADIFLPEKFLFFIPPINIYVFISRFETNAESSERESDR